MRHSAAFKTPPRAESPTAHGVEAAPGRKALVRTPRWISELGRVLRFGARPSRRSPAMATPPPATAAAEPPVDPAAATSFDRIYELAPRLRRAWSADTSVVPELWSAQRPALGQSAATACAVQDALGGDIVESTITLADGRSLSHFANVVDGLVIDLAQTEVERATLVSGPMEPREDFASMRDYLLSQPGAQLSYAALKSRLSASAGRTR
jgi:hypothetical protein